jgi:glutaminyl-peptide cyclotransferase
LDERTRLSTATGSSTGIVWTCMTAIRRLLTGLLAVGVSGYQKLNARQTRALLETFPPGEKLQIDDPRGFLEPILKVRIPGTDNSTQVRDHFASFFDQLSDEWNIELDQFYADTPTVKNVSFTNFIATRDPRDVEPGNLGRMVLAAHYDSKIEPEGFIGAIDSAVPCALVMYVIHAIDQLLTKKWTTSGDQVGIQVIFFDGEEAFHEWTDTDSIYGARHLASSMAEQIYPMGHKRRSVLDSIDVLVLMDLLGSSDPAIPSYFRETDWMHQKLGTVEARIRRLGLSKMNKDYRGTFFPRPAMFQYGGLIGDDHTPYLARGVPVLHLIPLQFPAVWHRIVSIHQT